MDFHMHSSRPTSEIPRRSIPSVTPLASPDVATAILTAVFGRV